MIKAKQIKKQIEDGLITEDQAYYLTNQIIKIITDTANGSLKADPPETKPEKMSNDQYYIYSGGIDFINLLKDGLEKGFNKEENILQLVKYVQRTNYSVADVVSIIMLRNYLEEKINATFQTTIASGLTNRQNPKLKSDRVENHEEKIYKYVDIPIRDILSNTRLSLDEKRIELEALKRIHEPYIKRSIPIREKTRLEKDNRGNYAFVKPRIIGVREEPDLFRIEAIRLIDKELLKLESQKKDSEQLVKIPYSKLVDIAAFWKSDESTKGLSETDFCARYRKADGSKINAGSLRQAWNGTGLYAKRSGHDVLRERMEDKKKKTIPPETRGPLLNRR